MTPARRVAPAEVPGLTARRIAADILDNVLRRRRPLDAELDGAEAHPGLAALADRDRACIVESKLLREATNRRLGWSIMIPDRNAAGYRVNFFYEAARASLAAQNQIPLRQELGCLC